jgi:hypothetical protein
MGCTRWAVQWPKQPPADLDDTLVNLALEAAQQQLWARTGRRFGRCTIVESYVVPTNGTCLPTPYKGTDGEWRNGFVGSSGIPLEHQPVRSVEAVTVNDVPWGEALWFLDAGTLRRRDGAAWPADASGRPLVTVAYTYGEDPPPLAALAMGELAYEMLQGFRGLDCRLPSNAVNITRQGVTIALADPAALDKVGRIGLPLSDAFIMSENPARLTARSRMYSPDMPRRSR